MRKTKQHIFSQILFIISQRIILKTTHVIAVGEKKKEKFL
jgi:hypothetical protein